MTRRDVDSVRANFVGAAFIKLVDHLGGSFAGARRGERDVRIPCFMHGGSGPNLVLTPARGLWHCLSSCGGGDVLALVERARGVDFRGALAWLADRAGIRLAAGGMYSARFDAKAASNVEDAREDIGQGMVAPSMSTRSGDACGVFLAALWCRVVERGWSAPVARWLSNERGIEPDAAYALGCRDWSTARDALAELVDETLLEVVEAVGLARDRRLHPALLGCLRGDGAWSAVAVPSWPLGAPCPTRWRFRLLEPRTVRDGARVKVFGPYGGGGDLLGLGRPERLDHPEVRLARLGSGIEGAGLVVLVEGEPDWLSATEIMDGRAVVLGVCGAPTRWRDTWPRLDELAALGVRRLAVCVHHGAPGADGLGHGERFARAVEGACARAGLDFTRKLAPEGADLYDLHRAGALSPWLADVLEVNHGP